MSQTKLKLTARPKRDTKPISPAGQQRSSNSVLRVSSADDETQIAPKISFSIASEKKLRTSFLKKEKKKRGEEENGKKERKRKKKERRKEDLGSVCNNWARSRENSILPKISQIDRRLRKKIRWIILLSVKLRWRVVTFAAVAFYVGIITLLSRA